MSDDLRELAKRVTYKGAVPGRINVDKLAGAAVAALAAAEKRAAELLASGRDAKRAVAVANEKALANEQLWVSAANRAEATERALADAKAECASLAASQCQAFYGDEYGNPSCKHIDRADTAEAQVAVLRKLLERALFLDANGGDIEDAVEKLCCEIHTALASLPDSAAKLLAVGDAAKKLRKTKLALLGSPVDDAALKQTYDAERELFDAVAAYKASRTGEDAQP
jgi:hypothetical protein